MSSRFRTDPTRGSPASLRSLPIRCELREAAPQPLRGVDQVTSLGERFRIRSIPTLAVLHGGKEVARTTG